MYGFRTLPVIGANIISLRRSKARLIVNRAGRNAETLKLHAGAARTHETVEVRQTQFTNAGKASRQETATKVYPV